MGYANTVVMVNWVLYKCFTHENNIKATCWHIPVKCLLCIVYIKTIFVNK